MHACAWVRMFKNDKKTTLKIFKKYFFHHAYDSVFSVNLVCKTLEHFLSFLNMLKHVQACVHWSKYTILISNFIGKYLTFSQQSNFTSNHIYINLSAVK